MINAPSDKPSGILRGAWPAIDSLAGTIAFRLTALVVAAMLLAGAAAVTTMFWLSSQAMSRQLVELLSSEAGELSAIARSAEPSRLAALISERSKLDPARLYYLAGPGLTRVAGNLERWPAAIAIEQPGGSFSYGADRLAAGVVVALPGGQHLLVARDLSAQQALAHGAMWTLIAGFGALSLAGLAAGLVMSRVVLNRIDTMAATAGQILSGEISGRIPISARGDELDRLAAHLNAMLDRIAQLMAGLREVSDNIAHDLRTPLTRLRHRAEAALRDPAGGPAHRAGLEQVIEEADALIATFNALLLIARLESGSLDTTAETFDLGAMAADIAELYQPLAEENGLALELHAAPDLTVTANRQLVSQAIANLVDNAIKYGRPARPSGVTSAVVARRAERAGGRIRIVVSDHGPGIPAADRERVLRRFVRLDASRTAPGTGLGLSLVAAVSQLIGGKLVLGDNAPGLKVTLELPESPAAAPLAARLA